MDLSPRNPNYTIIYTIFFHSSRNCLLSSRSNVAPVDRQVETSDVDRTGRLGSSRSRRRKVFIIEIATGVRKRDEALANLNDLMDASLIIHEGGD